MTAREQDAFRLGVRHAADLALIVAVTMECRDDAHTLRLRSAIEALQAFAEAVKAEATPDDANQPLKEHRHEPNGPSATGACEAAAQDREACPTSDASGTAS